MDQSANLVQLQLGRNIFDRADYQKVHGTTVVCAFYPIQMQCFDPTCPQYRLHLGQLWPDKAPGRAQPGPTWPQLRPQLGPNLTPGATSPRLEIDMASKWATWPAQYQIFKAPVFTGISIFFASFKARSNVPHVVPPVGPNLVQSCRDRAPSCALHMISLQCRAHLDRCGPNFSLT